MCALIWTTIDHRPGPRDGKMIRTASIGIHIYLKIFVSTSVQLSVAVRVPSVNESIGVLQLIVVTLQGRMQITGLVVSCTVISVEYKCFDSNSHRSPSRSLVMVKLSGQLPLVSTSVFQKIFGRYIGTICCGQGTKCHESIGVLQLIVVSFGQKCKSQVYRILYRDQLNTSAFDSNSHRSPSRSLVMVKLSGQLPLVFTSVSKIFVKSIGAIICCGQRPKCHRIDRCIAIDRRILWAEGNHRFSRILYRDQLNTSALILNSYRSPSRSSWW